MNEHKKALNRKHQADYRKRHGDKYRNAHKHYMRWWRAEKSKLIERPGK